ncbi:MAG: hypothetical protein ACKVS8_09115 [Phycisphaerales bacterium]
MDPIVKNILLGIALPLALGTAGFALAWWRRRGPATLDHPPGTPAAHDPTWMAPALLLIIYSGLSPMLLGTTAFPPKAANDWFPIAAVAAGLLGMMADSVRLHGAAKWVVRWAVVVLLYLGVAIQAVRLRWTGQEDLLWIGGAASVTLAMWWCLARTTNGTRGASGPILSSGLCAAAAAVLALTGNLRSAQGLGFIAAATGGALLISWFRPRLTLARGGVHVPAIMTGICLFDGVVYRETLWWQALLVTTIPAAGLLVSLVPAQALGGWKRTLAVTVVAALPGAAAVGPLVAGEIRKQAEEHAAE